MTPDSSKAKTSPAGRLEYAHFPCPCYLLTSPIEGSFLGLCQKYGTFQAISWSADCEQMAKFILRAGQLNKQEDRHVKGSKRK
jgi:hypothetical protein